MSGALYYIEYKDKNGISGLYICLLYMYDCRFTYIFFFELKALYTINVIQEQAPTSTTTPSAPDDAGRPPAQTRLGPLPPASKLSLNNMVKKSQAPGPAPVEKVQ